MALQAPPIALMMVAVEVSAGAAVVPVMPSMVGLEPGTGNVPEIPDSALLRVPRVARWFLGWSLGWFDTES